MRTFKTLLSILFLVVGTTLFATNWDVVKTPLKWTNQGIDFILRDQLRVREMSWPRTLLEYAVDFSASPVAESNLWLIDAVTNQHLPFQFTDIRKESGKIISATLCFFSDLPSGGEKKFRLFESSSGPVKATNPSLSVASANGTMTISNGKIRVVLPFPGTHKRMVPPIIRIADDSDFFVFEENMSGFSEKDSLAWQIKWNNFRPEYRYCNNRPEKPIDYSGVGYSQFPWFKTFPWEPIQGNGEKAGATYHPDFADEQNNGPDGLLPFNLTPYHNKGFWWRLHTSAFWDNRTGKTVGLFIKDFENWIDPEYPIYGNRPNLSVSYYYLDSRFWWSLPLVTGKRSLAVAIYPHQKDMDVVNETNLPYLYIDELRRWNGWISLNKVKNWILDYEPCKPVAPDCFEPYAEHVGYSALHGLLEDKIRRVRYKPERSRSGRFPVDVRNLYNDFVQEMAEADLTTEEYRQVRAMMLFMTYVYMDEALMPMKTMLAGHPDFFSDVKGVSGLAAFLFPDHPYAKEMADNFEKSIALNLRYHVRPDIPVWDAKGGRWTENLGHYVWASLRNMTKTSFLLIIYYYANGKRYSHNEGSEDVGDVSYGDTERCTNFGVKKNEKCYRCIGDYRSVGRNDLTDPLYDFGFAQYASINANNEAAPEYKSRSVILSGNDYFVVFDDLRDETVEGRFSWFVGSRDSFPYIHQLMPGAKPQNINKTGRYYDGKGDFLTLVTHKKEVQASLSGSICEVKRNSAFDLVFRGDKNISYSQSGNVFEGTSGIIRHDDATGEYEAALFIGDKLGIPGVSVCWIKKHPAAGADSYNIQMSTDSEKTWLDVAPDIKVTNYKLSGLTDGKKVHVRIIARGKGGLSEPSNDYPIYPTSAVPHCPEGLWVVKEGSKVNVSWGQILGANNYTLYRRTKGTSDYQTVYSGPERNTAFVLPDSLKVYEFCITATNGNGESGKSVVSDTDENRIINWYPVPGETYRRVTESYEQGYSEWNNLIERNLPVLKYMTEEKSNK